MEKIRCLERKVKKDNPGVDEWQEDCKCSGENEQHSAPGRSGIVFTAQTRREEMDAASGQATASTAWLEGRTIPEVAEETRPSQAVRVGMARRSCSSRCGRGWTQEQMRQRYWR